MSDAAKAYIIKPAEHGGFGVMTAGYEFLFAGSLTDCLKFIAEQYSPPLIAQGDELVPGAGSVRYVKELSPGPDQKAERPIYPFEQLLGLS